MRLKASPQTLFPSPELIYGGQNGVLKIRVLDDRQHRTKLFLVPAPPGAAFLDLRLVVPFVTAHPDGAVRGGAHGADRGRRRDAHGYGAGRGPTCLDRAERTRGLSPLARHRGSGRRHQPCPRRPSRDGQHAHCLASVWPNPTDRSGRRLQISGRGIRVPASTRLSA